MKLSIVFSFVLLIFIPGLSQQQFSFQLWHDGKVILDTSDTVRGQVKYNMQNDIVEVLGRPGLQTYTARKIVSFEIFDVLAKRYRMFYSLPYALNGQYKAPVFFELIQEGKMTLLSREVLEVRTYSSYYMYGTSARTVLVNKYFLLKEDGSIQPFTGKKGDLISLMGNKGTQVERFMKQNRLDISRKYDFGRIVEYYNSLF